MKRDWYYFPLTKGGKRPWTKHGWQDASADPLQIDKWMREKPGCNWGLACGMSGLTVVDVDPRNGGLVSFEAIKDLLPPTYTVLTGGGGWHYYYRGITRSSTPFQGIDLQSDGKYVVAEGSIHPSGRFYACVADLPLALLPDWLRSAVQKSRPARDDLVDASSFRLGKLCMAMGLLGRQIKPGIWTCLCPNRHRHTCGYDHDTSTVLHAPPPDKPHGPGKIHCKHSNCQQLINVKRAYILG